MDTDASGTQAAPPSVLSSPLKRTASQLTAGGTFAAPTPTVPVVTASKSVPMAAKPAGAARPGAPLVANAPVTAKIASAAVNVAPAASSSSSASPLVALAPQTAAEAAAVAAASAQLLKRADDELRALEEMLVGAGALDSSEAVSLGDADAFMDSVAEFLAASA